MKIIFPELTTNQIAQTAASHFEDIEFLPADSLNQAVTMLQNHEADSMISGLDYSSRDVVLACKDKIPMASKFFSSCFICQKNDQLFALADGGINKQPTTEQLITIVEDTAKTFQVYTDTTPRIAMLSYSTNGSGGKNPDLAKIRTTITQIRQNHPNWVIDGEMQLDAAIDPDISRKKFPASAIAGKANILITPDLNSGNILYKSLERFGGFTIAGPIIQGFTTPLADLSRGSTVDDVILTIKVLLKLGFEESVGGYDRDRRSAPPVTTGWRDSVSEKPHLSNI